MAVGCGRRQTGNAAPHMPHTQEMAKHKGAYVAHRRRSRSVPGSDVRVEHRRLVERLHTGPRALKERAYYGVCAVYSTDERSTKEGMHGPSLDRPRPTADRARSAACHALQGTHPSRRRWQSAHTLLISVIPAVFHAPMFALNTDAPLNACEPSHALSKSPRRMSPDGQCSTRRVNWASGCGAMCWPSTIEMQGNRKNGDIFRAVTYYRVCGVSVLPEKSQARKQAPHPQPSHGSGRPMQQQHSVWAKARQPSTSPSTAKPSTSPSTARACAEAQQRRTERPTDDGAPHQARRLVHATEGVYLVHV
jgi:hypothetical protein